MYKQSLDSEYRLLDDLSFTNAHSLRSLSARHNIKLIDYAVQAGFVSQRPDLSCHLTKAGAQRLADLRVLLASSEQEAKYQANQNAKEKRGVVRSWQQFFLGIFLGWLLGCFTPREVFQFLYNLFAKILH